MNTLQDAYSALGYATATAWVSGGAGYIASGGKFKGGVHAARSLTSFVVRAHWSAVRGIGNTPFVRGGSHTIARATGAIAAGYLLGAVVGTGIARAAWGKSGQAKATDLYTFQVSPTEYFQTLKDGFLS